MRTIGCAVLALVVGIGALSAQHNPTFLPAERELHGLDTPEAEPLPAEESFLPKKPPATPIQRMTTRFPSGKDSVAVDIFRSEASAPLPVVLLLHGAHPKRAEKHYLRMAEDLAAKGYLSLFVRYYERGHKGRGRRSQWRTTLHDAVTFASSLPEADPQRLGVVGYSLGAFLALGGAPLDNRIRAVVAYYGGISRDTDPEIAKTAPPTLLLHGTHDRIVPFRRSVEAYEVLRREGRPADLVVYPGARHGFCLNGRGGTDGRAAADAWDRTVAFLDFHLQRPAATQPPFLSPLAWQEKPLCLRLDNSCPPFLSNPPRYLAPFGLGSLAREALVNPTRQELDQLLAATRRAKARRASQPPRHSHKPSPTSRANTAVARKPAPSARPAADPNYALKPALGSRTSPPQGAHADPKALPRGPNVVKN